MYIYISIHIYIYLFKQKTWWYLKNVWFIMKHPIKMDDLGICIYIYINEFTYRIQSSESVVTCDTSMTILVTKAIVTRQQGETLNEASICTMEDSKVAMDSAELDPLYIVSNVAEIPRRPHPIICFQLAFKSPQFVDDLPVS